MIRGGENAELACHRELRVRPINIRMVESVD